MEPGAERWFESGGYSPDACALWNDGLQLYWDWPHNTLWSRRAS